MTLDPSYFEAYGLPPPIEEFQFHPTRKWRFDYAWPSHKIALEINGGRFVGGRHNSAEGSHKDMEKMNEAACRGWRVLYITPRSVGTLVPVELVRRAMEVSR